MSGTIAQNGVMRALLDIQHRSAPEDPYQRQSVPEIKCCNYRSRSVATMEIEGEKDLIEFIKIYS